MKSYGRKFSCSDNSQERYRTSRIVVVLQVNHGVSANAKNEDNSNEEASYEEVTEDRARSTDA